MSKENHTQQLGDGQDNPVHAARKSIEAGRKIGQAAGKAAEQGAEMGAKAAGAAVKVGVQGGKAVSQIAVGSAAGPWGTAVAAAWSLRHTLFKILICLCLLLMFLVAMVVNLPAILFNSLFHTDPATVDTAAPTDVNVLFDQLSAAVADCITAGYNASLAEVEELITAGGYNYEVSMEALINNGYTSADYNVCYILAAYSLSMEQRGTTQQDMIDKLDAVKTQMFPVTYEAKQTTITIPPETEGGQPTYEDITYLQCTIHPFNQSVILSAFQIDTEAQYGQFSVTCGEAIESMSAGLQMTMYGAVGNGAVPPINDAELTAFLANLSCSEERKALMNAALSLVGRVPYFWGGKSAAGWNEEWNTPKLVTSAGAGSSGTIRPYGLDCSGFTDWVYKTALGQGLPAGSANQWDGSTEITADQLLPGDLGFKAVPGSVPINHVLLYAGMDAEGNRMWVHCASGTGVVLNTPSYVSYYRRPNGIDLGD